MFRFGFGLVAVLTTFGCSGAEKTDGPAALNDLSCGYRELRLRGSLNGEVVDRSTVALNQFFHNDGTAGLQVGLQNGVLVLVMEKPTPEGGTSRARAEADNLVSLYNVGNCETGPFVSWFNLSSDGKTARFRLEQLVAKPYCGGMPVEGQLDGCYGLDL
jgi:hypothetical protein